MTLEQGTQNTRYLDQIGFLDMIQCSISDFIIIFHTPKSSCVFSAQKIFTNNWLKKVVEKLSKQNKWPTPVSVLLCQVLHLEAQNTQIYIVFNQILFDTTVVLA